jgi:hypothetical protein
MITVAILVNGKPLMARSAVNKSEKNEAGETRYSVDDGSTVWHKTSDGVVALAKKLLETLVEDTERPPGPRLMCSHVASPHNLTRCIKCGEKF